MVKFVDEISHKDLGRPFMNSFRRKAAAEQIAKKSYEISPKAVEKPSYLLNMDEGFGSELKRGLSNIGSSRLVAIGVAHKYYPNSKQHEDISSTAKKSYEGSQAVKKISPYLRDTDEGAVSKNTETCELQSRKTKVKSLTSPEHEEVISTSEESVDEEEEAIPQKLELAIRELCKSKDIAKYTLLQNPTNMKNIAIVGNTVKQLAEDLEKLENEFPSYSLFVVKKDSRVHTKQFMKVERFGIERDATCELILRAFLPGSDTEAFFAVAPAHMMFTRKKNRRLMAASNIAAGMEVAKQVPTRKVYQIRLELVQEWRQHAGLLEEETLRILNVHPPLIGYRYHYEREQNEEVEEDEAEMMAPHEQALPLEEKFCLNDMVLLSFRGPNPEEIQQQQQTYRETPPERVVQITTWNKLIKYNRPAGRVIKIFVKNCFGQLCNNFHTVRYQRNEGIAHHLLFTLNDGELNNGDSGSIVYKVRRNRVLCPLGLLIGKFVDGVFPNTYYKAVILSQALQYFQTRYNLGELTLYTISAAESNVPTTDESDIGLDEVVS
ncbi:uncharacterized protein [Watersipora subatra]|uniref:uncharacterized protein n=1 Tax=Watersipora subatra TaxID=2589382 RepID=UPI00355BEB7F